MRTIQTPLNTMIRSWSQGLLVLAAAGALTAGVATNAAAAAPPARNLSTCPTQAKGLAGPCVTALQKALNAHGAHLKVDGIDGPQTTAAVERFQRQHDLAVDGQAGPQTDAALAPHRAAPPPQITRARPKGGSTAQRPAAPAKPPARCAGILVRFGC